MSFRTQAYQHLSSREVAERVLALPTPLSNHLSLLYSSPLPQIPSPPLPIPPPPPIIPTYAEESLGSRAAGIRRRDALPSHDGGPTTARADLYGFADTLEAAPGCPMSRDVDDARYDRALLRARVNTLESDSPFHRRTAILMEEEARLSRAAWAQSMDACDQRIPEGILLYIRTHGYTPAVRDRRVTGSRPEETNSDFIAAKNQTIVRRES
ncbi:hypothetical protein Tco_0938517 [Tanacetum coccineum]|uniref:Uncharacterized protein n=1 Tax=Tanacetum coccineum TaxID=301880 RepID=A0ABQ5DI23_9ASTR